MQKFTPFLWFDGKLEEAVKFYTTVFSNARVENLNPMSATFVIEGQEFMVLNGGPQFKFNEAVSFCRRPATCCASGWRSNPTMRLSGCGSARMNINLIN